MADYYIPFEIQSEIIQKLPIKSLIRFGSVSKQWKSFIQSSKFIANYHDIHHTHSQHHLLVLDYAKEDDCEAKYVAFVDDATFPRQKLSFTLPLSILLIKRPILVGSSQGVLCFFNRYGKPSDHAIKEAVFWNPTIKRSINIDVPGVFSYDNYDTLFGFGVCPRTSDPKLVKIPCDTDSVYMGSNITTPVEVYTLSSRVWRRLCRNLPHDSLKFELEHVVIDEFIYWLVYDARVYGRIPLLMTFNLTSEEFAEVNLPYSLAGFKRHYLYIRKLRDSLVVVEYNYESQNTDVWRSKTA